MILLEKLQEHFYIIQTLKNADNTLQLCVLPRHIYETQSKYFGLCGYRVSILTIQLCNIAGKQPYATYN